MMENTFTNAMLYIDKLEKPAAFTSWIRTIVHSEIYHYHKKEEHKKNEKKRTRKGLNRTGFAKKGLWLDSTCQFWMYGRQ